MQLISEFNKGIRFLLCVIDIFSKYGADLADMQLSEFNVGIRFLL